MLLQFRPGGTCTDEKISLFSNIQWVSDCTLYPHFLIYPLPMKIQIFSLLLGLFLLQSNLTHAQESQRADVIVYGGTASGCIAAIQVKRMGHSVILIEPGNRVGGLTTGGLGQTDIGSKEMVGGMSREFYEGIAQYYSDPANWKWEKRSEYKDGGQTKTESGEASMWTFEPSAALAVMEQMLAAVAVKPVYGERLDRNEEGIRMENNRIISITMESGRRFEADMFIDATYEGDLMALAGVSYTTGREPNSQYQETLNGVQADRMKNVLDPRKAPSRNAYHHNFVERVDPYIVAGNPDSGLLPHIDPKGPGVEGEGDSRIQAYCFRMCLTDHPDNRIPFHKPKDYQERNYELLLRNYEAGEKGFPWINSAMPNRKTDTNNRTGFSTDFIGQNYKYPEGSYAEREAIIAAHRNYQQGLMWTLAYHPRMSEHIRKEVSRWGMSKDEFTEGNGWQGQLYIREARRMTSDLVMTQHHCESREIDPQPIGMAGYGMDSHHTQRYVDVNGFVRNEGNVEARVPHPFGIGYQAIIPRKGEAENLAVPICVSASHIAFGSIRMEPVFMITGQAAATAAVLALEHKTSLQELDYSLLQQYLLRDKQVLRLP